MDIQGKVVEILPKQTFNGKSGEFVRYAFILETQGQYPKKVKIDVIGDDKWQKMDIVVGETFSVSCDISSRKWKESWFTSCEGWRALKIGNAQYSTPKPSIAPKSVEPKEEPKVQQEEGESENLPF